MDIAQDGNLFPREDILEAVAQSDWRDQPVRPWAWILASLGVFFVSLGWPIVAPLTASTVNHSANHAANLLHPLHVLAGWLGPATGLGIEFTWYALSSVCLALSVGAIGAAVRALGVGPRLTFAVAIVAALSPGLLSHGRLPSDYPAGVLGTGLLLALVLAPSDPGPAGARGYGMRVSAGLLLAALLHPWSLVAGPAVALAAWSRGEQTAAAPVAIAWVASTATMVLWGTNLGTDPAGAPGALAQLLTLGPLVAFAPFAWSHSEEESSPPAWMTLWVLSAIVGTLFASKALHLSSLPMALPVLAVMFAGVLSRLARPDNARRVALALALSQALIVGLLPWITAPQGSDGLAAASPDVFAAGDVVYVPEEEGHARTVYLLRRRFNVRVEEGTLAAPQANPEGTGRAVGLGANSVWTPYVLNAAAGTVVRRD